MILHVRRLPSSHCIQAWAVLLSLALCGTCAAGPIRLQRIPAASSAGTPAAVRVANADLVHTTQLLPPDTSVDDAATQVTGVLSQLDRVLEEFQSSRSDVVKLNLYVRDASVREAFLDQLADWSAGHAPAVASVATALSDPHALVGLDAVFASRRSETASTPERVMVAALKGDKRRAHASVLPQGDAVYISGQAEPGDFAEATRATLDGLERTLQTMQLDKRHIVQIKCYMRPMSDADVVHGQMAAFFGSDAVPPVSLVEWVSAPWPIEIDLVAWAPAEESDETVSFSTPPWMPTSPVYSKVARVHGNDRIYVAGLTSPEAGSRRAAGSRRVSPAGKRRERRRLRHASSGEGDVLCCR